MVVVDAIRSDDPTCRWSGSAAPNFLVAGHSHRVAFTDYFNRSGATADIAVLDTAADIHPPEGRYWTVAVSSARRLRLPLCIVWDGNRHNAHFLLESAERF